MTTNKHTIVMAYLLHVMAALLVATSSLTHSSAWPTAAALIAAGLTHVKGSGSNPFPQTGQIAQAEDQVGQLVAGIIQRRKTATIASRASTTASTASTYPRS